MLSTFALADKHCLSHHHDSRATAQFSVGVMTAACHINSSSQEATMHMAVMCKDLTLKCLNLLKYCYSVVESGIEEVGVSKTRG